MKHSECVHRWLSPIIVTLIGNAMTGCHPQGQALVMNAANSHISAPCFDQEKSKCFESFENFTMSVI